MKKTLYSYISRVIKTNFLIFLVSKDKNSCFFTRRTPQGFSFFTFFRVSLFTFLGCFHYSPFSSVFIFHLSRPLSFLTFLARFIFHLFRVFFFCCTASATDLRKFFFYSQAFFTLHPFPTFAAVPRVLQIWESFFYSQAFFTLQSFQVVLPWRLQGLPLRFETQTWPICLFESHSFSKTC